MSHKKHLLLLALLAIVFIPTIYFSKNTPTPASAVSTQLSGYAWSSNLGWINFNGNGGNVTIDSVTGKLSGYAWNADDSGISGGAKSGIGWIYFGGDSSMAGGIASAPAEPRIWATLDRTTGKISGWARACSVFQSGCNGTLNNNSIDGVMNGGWDGWISLAGTATNGSTYGVQSKLESSGVRTFYGYAWGGGNSPTTESSPQSIGWISFNYTDQGAPTVPPPGGAPGGVTVIETVAVPTQTCWDGSVIPVTSSCPVQMQTCWDGSTIPVTSSCPTKSILSFYQPGLNENAATVKFSNNEPTKACKAGTTCISPVVSIYVEGSVPNSLIVLSVVDVHKLNDVSSQKIDQKYWNYNNINKPVFTPPAIKAQEPSSLTIKFTRQPDDLSRLPSGVYYIRIMGTPENTSLDPFYGWLKVTISSTGGTYIEQ